MWLVGVLLAGVAIVWMLLPHLQVYRDPAAWQAFLDAANGKDPYLQHYWDVSVYLLGTTVLLFVVLELRRMVNHWDTPSAPALRRRQLSLIGVALMLLLLLVLRGC